ncbi:MAG: helix-turn-helix domain-containing protein [Clostridiales bacterium]|jgi:xylan 1,4-beta-xylosidase|nr:helix-turn-helix domain-containing protein [Clostridiales bacterium]
MQISENGLVLGMFINASLLRSHQDLLGRRRIFCCSESLRIGESESKFDKFDKVRAYVARAFEAIFKEREHNRIYVYSQAMGLLSYLDEHFSAPSDDNEASRDMQRRQRILEYIEGHYSEPITLEQISASEYLSPGFFSRYFHKTLGSTFTQYLKTVKLGHAYTELCNTGTSITKISLNNGFANTNSFIAAFKEAYGLTPRKYRKLHEGGGKSPDFIEYKVSGVFKPLAKHLDGSPAAGGIPESEAPVRVVDLAVDTRRACGALTQTWRRLLAVGWAKEALLAPVQEQIQRCQDEIGFEFLRFRGLLDDDMIVYREVEGKPHVEFSYVPSALARDSKVSFEHNSVISIPKDMDRRAELIRALLRHWINRYGFETAASWKYVILNGYLVYLGHFTMEEYADLYERTRDCVKALLPGAEFGGPGCDIGGLGVNRDWETFFEICRKRGCVPDFVILQCFHSDFHESAGDVSSASRTHEKAPLTLSHNPNYLRDRLRSLACVLRKTDIRNPRICLETWNSTM